MITISAWAAKEKGGLLKKFTYQSEIRPLETLVKVKYCSLTRGDIRFIDNFWGDIVYPVVPGLEIIGVVEETGSEVKNLKIGEYVGIGYQIGSCFKCEYCLSGKEQFCASQKVIPINGYGGLAEQIIVDYRFCFPLPKNLQTPEAAPLMCSGLTPFSAIRKAGVKRGMKTGVVGIGSLGHLTIQVLNKIGCDVTAFSHSKNKEVILNKLGVNKSSSSTDDKELSRFVRKFDFIISTSSASLNWDQYLKALKPNGTLCFVGLPPENISFKAELLADYAQKIILGSYIGSRKDMKDLLKFAAENEIKAVENIFPIKGINEAIEKMRNSEIPFSTVIVV